MNYCGDVIPLYTSRPFSTALLQKGGTLGLQVTKDRTLSYFINWNEIEVAITDIPDEVYGFVDLWNDYCPAVKLIPDVRFQEVRRQNYAVNIVISSQYSRPCLLYFKQESAGYQAGLYIYKYTFGGGGGGGGAC